MRTVKNNEGKEIAIPADLYNELAAEYEAGTWAVYLTIGGQTHCIIIPDNFQ